ncbi:MAG TPA: Flp family type IVb pilin [Woeseiaceae bacterium]|nr:Flp family type IVb pilin [Woeseiaceae bacterium]
MTVISHLWRDERGATAIEYGLIAALIAVALIAAISGMGTGLSNKYTGIANELNK